MDLLLFAVAAVIAIIAALLVVLQRNPMYSALYLIVTLFCLAVLYLQLNAQFVAAMQVVVYAGAIMVLFLFVIMLLNQGKPLETVSALTCQNPLAAVFALFLFIEMVLLVTVARVPHAAASMPVNATTDQLGTVQTIATATFTRYLFPFELTSVILLIGMIGVVVLAKRKVE